MIEKFKSLIRFDAGEDLLPQLVFVISTLLFTHKEHEEWWSHMRPKIISGLMKSGHKWGQRLNLKCHFSKIIGQKNKDLQTPFIF